MYFISSGLSAEASNRMASDMFRALDLRELGFSDFAGKLENKVPIVLESLGINGDQIAEVIVNATDIVYGALDNLRDERLQQFIAGEI